LKTKKVYEKTKKYLENEIDEKLKLDPLFDKKKQFYE
jgi:hypothetical protein